MPRAKEEPVASDWELVVLVSGEEMEGGEGAGGCALSSGGRVVFGW